MTVEKLLTKIFNRTIPVGLITFVALGCTTVAQPNPDSDAESNPLVQYCTPFDSELPEDFVVYGADTYEGIETLPYPIDDSDIVASEIDIIVNSPAQPAVLLLGANNPVVWDIQWTEDTEIIEVVAYGSHRQAVAGLPNDTPVLINTSDRCGDDSFKVDRDDKSTLEQLSRDLYGQSLEQSPSTYGTDSFVLGEPIEENSVLLSSDDTSVESFLDRTAPRVSHLGIEDAVKQGVLRQATVEDVEAWVEAHLKYQESAQGKVFSSAQERESRKAELIGKLEELQDLENIYVVLGDFTYPAGLYANDAPIFIVSEGVPQPSGYSGHSSVHGSSGKCLSLICESTVDNLPQEL